MSGAKENVRPRDEAEEENGNEKRSRGSGEMGVIAEPQNALTFACRPFRGCEDSFPILTVCLKQGPNAVKQLVKYLFESSLEKLTGEKLTSHLWFIRDEWNRRLLLCSDDIVDDDFGGGCSDSDEDDNYPHIDVDNLEVGDVLHFSYDEHSHRPVFYKFTLTKVSPTLDPEEVFPRYSTVAARSELTQAEKVESGKYRQRREELARAGRLIAFSRSNALKTGGDGMVQLPDEEWGRDELQSISLLIKAGMGFKAAWKNLLQYALLTRSEAATSNKFYGVKRSLRPIAGTTDAQKEELRKKAVNLLLARREDTLTQTTIEDLEGLAAKAWSSFHKWDEFRQLMNTRDGELTEEQRQRKSVLFGRYA